MLNTSDEEERKKKSIELITELEQMQTESSYQIVYVYISIRNGHWKE